MGLMERLNLKAAWDTVPTLSKVGIVVLGALLVAWAVTSTFGWASEARASRKYEAAQKAESDKRAQLEQERDRLLAEAAVLEARAAAQEAVIAQGTARIQAAEAKIKEAIDEENREMAVAAEPVDAATRRARLCAKLAALGYPCGD